MKKAICVTNIIPSKTGTGGALGVFGNGACVAKSGYDLSFVVTCEIKNAPKISFPVISIYGPTEVEIINNLDNYIKNHNIELVWIHATMQWHYFKSLRNQVAHVLFSSDPEWEIEIIRNSVKEKRKNPLKRVIDYYRFKKRVQSLRKKEFNCFSEAEKYGIVANWSAYDVQGMRKRTGINVELCPLAFPDWGDLRSYDNQKDSVLLLGHLTSSQTRIGIKYFFDQLFFDWMKGGIPFKSIIRLVGGGKLPKHFHNPSDNDYFKWIGFAESLKEEWKRAHALIVPVPVKTGFRTKIIEAWSVGTPVIAHPAAAEGIKEMEDGYNYLSAVSIKEWIEAIQKLENENVLASRIAENGRKTFEEHYSVDAGAERFGQLSQKAVDKFNSKKIEKDYISQKSPKPSKAASAFSIPSLPQWRPPAQM